MFVLFLTYLTHVVLYGTGYSKTYGAVLQGSSWGT